jgi:hypothetical protein
VPDLNRGKNACMPPKTTSWGSTSMGDVLPETLLSEVVDFGRTGQSFSSSRDWIDMGEGGDTSPFGELSPALGGLGSKGLFIPLILLNFFVSAIRCRRRWSLIISQGWHLLVQGPGNFQHDMGPDLLSTCGCFLSCSHGCRVQVHPA